MKTRSVPDSVIHYASDLMNTEDVAALDQTIQDLTTEEDPGKDDLLGNGDDESVTVLETFTDAFEALCGLINERNCIL